MKAIFSALLALSCVTVSAQAQVHDEDVPVTVPVTILPVRSEPVVAPVEIPEEVSDASAIVEFLESLKLVNLTHIAYLDAQTKYFQLMRTSFENGLALSKAYNEGSWQQAGTGVGVTGVNVVLDAFLAKTFHRTLIASGSLGALKDIVFASRGEQGRLMSVASKTWKSAVEFAKYLKAPKNFFTTAALGSVVYVQYKTYYAINLSPAQYDAMMKALNAKIASLEARKAELADPHAPILN